MTRYIKVDTNAIRHAYLADGRKHSTLARASGITRVRLCQILAAQGVINLMPATLDRLAAALGVTKEELMAHED